ncbi:hypothetical protein GCM10018790_64970 [Kitasatospora xanthocidica]|uniref:DUF4232 domain-containing protein n=1 Tax=Kitasatospora xanthocidica TaxID=83382 RepID=UPI001678D43F|nr:DUF4232 domain-containing protein [Kitasatospora xanthocidica]GHF78019.1 hypothetical protein GCM10018790_64970 [Kitasatospora xanthocidica]
MSVRHRRSLLASAALVVGAGLALTACGPDNADPAGGSAAPAPATAAATPSAGAPAPAAPTANTPATAGTSHTAAPAPHTPSGASPSGGTHPDGGGAGSTARPCDIQNLAINAAARTGAPNQWVIEVHNTGTAACSLSSSPGVDLGNSTARDQSKNIKPILASGTLRVPVAAGQKAYAVIDLDPSGATTGTAPGINEINVLVDDEGTNMPLANTRNFPLPGGAHVLNPQMGLYRPTVAEAVTSMAGAGK